jgi:hypothetical protein
MITSSLAARSPWDDVEHAVLSTLTAPRTIRETTEMAGLTLDFVKNQLEVYVRQGLATTTVSGGIRYQLTLVGYKRMFALMSPQSQMAA